MSGMNHRRPQFQRQDLWVKYDQYESPKARRHRQLPVSQRYAKLDPLLFSYTGDVQRLLMIQAKRLGDQDLTNSDQAFASRSCDTRPASLEHDY